MRRACIRQGAALLAVAVLIAACSRQPEQLEQAEPRPPVETRASVDRAVATTGDLITFRVTVDHDPGYEIELSEPGAEIAGFRITDVGREEPRRQGERIIQEHWYELRADLVGSYVLPPVHVRFRRLPEPRSPEAAAGEGQQEDAPWQSVATSEIFVEVASVLPVGGEAQDIRDLKPLRRIRSPLPWGIVAGATAALLLVALAIWIYLRRRRAALQVPVLPPHILAFQALDELRQADFDDPLAVRRFYFAISATIRAYVEGRFGINATDLTSEEILELLPRVDGLDSGPSVVLQQFLLATDRVKFAHHQPAAGEIEAAYEQGLAFVEATQPRAELEKEAA